MFVMIVIIDLGPAYRACCMRPDSCLAQTNRSASWDRCPLLSTGF